MSDQIVVVPLDGSELSERVLPFASVYARAMGARLLLVTVWEGPDEAFAMVLPSVAEDMFSAARGHYERYLELKAGKWRSNDLTIDAEVLSGHPADEIIRTAEARKASLLVLASHGRSGLGRWWYGGVASALVRRTRTWTLVIGPKVLERAAKDIQHGSILVPLDGSELSEAALEPAKQFATLFGAEIVLAQVLSWAGRAFLFDVPANTVAEIDRELTKASEEYLSKVAARLGEAPRVKTETLHGLPADTLIDLVARKGIDLIVMTTHGRGGLARAALGSVADRMLQASAPVLLIRPAHE